MKKNELFKVYLSTGRNNANRNRTAVTIFSAHDSDEDILAALTLDHLRAGYHLENTFESKPMVYSEAIKLASNHCDLVESVLKHNTK